MLLIKRYPNRKLYDTEAKKYITLDGIAEMIRDGREVQVVDHTNGEDLTTIILTQIIFEQEKKQGGFLPRSVLQGLVQAGGDTVTSLRKTLASPLDMLTHVDEEIRTRINGLVKRGEMTLEEGQNLLEKMLNQRRGNAPSSPLSSNELSAKLDELGVPTREEINHLTSQLEALESALDAIVGSKPDSGHDEALS